MRCNYGSCDSLTPKAIFLSPLCVYKGSFFLTIPSGGCGPSRVLLQLAVNGCEWDMLRNMRNDEPPKGSSNIQQLSIAPGSYINPRVPLCAHTYKYTNRNGVEKNDSKSIFLTNHATTFFQTSKCVWGECDVECRVPQTFLIYWVLSWKGHSVSFSVSS